MRKWSIFVGYAGCLGDSLCWAGLACRRELPRPAYEEGLSLFPLETGRTWIYEVRETTYTTAGSVTQTYLLRMRIDTPTVDAYGRPSFT